MDIYYQRLASDNIPIVIKNKPYTYLTNIYCLVASGNPDKFMYDIYHGDKPLSIRYFLFRESLEKIIYTMDEFLHKTYIAYISRCEQCRRSTKCCSFLNLHNLCYLCSCHMTLEARALGISDGKKYHQKLFHHYYLFSQIDLIDDIKYCIRQYLFHLKSI